MLASRRPQIGGTGDKMATLPGWRAPRKCHARLHTISVASVHRFGASFPIL